MANESIAISIKDISKNFRLPHERVSSIKDLFVHPAKAFRGSKTSEVQHALKNISFNIVEGEFFGIVGRNGSGKSTLLKILAEIYQPSSGNVSVKGKLVPFIELGVGFNPELTGRENVYLSGALNGFDNQEIDEMYDDIVNFAELEPFMEQKLKNYSSGMQVRLAFSVATRSRADILLIDEVLAVGDADFQRKCFDYFKELKRNKKTVVFVSHDMNAVREYCDRAALIDDSKLVEVGIPDLIANKYTRLFTPADGAPNGTNTGSRWGDGSIKYDSVKIEKTDDHIILLASATAKQHIEEPVFGFTIRDSMGNPILGTNSYIVKHATGRIKKDAHIKIQWKIPEVFSNGRHDVDITIIGQDRVTNHDWWESAVQFHIEKKASTPYRVSPVIDLRVEE
jgi:ABC-2 type transport system ATP-binding protein